MSNLAKTVMQRHPQLGEKWAYEWGVVLTGFLELWRNEGDQQYFDYLKRNLDYFIEPDGQIRTYRLSDYNLDNIQPGRLLFALLEITGDERYKNAILRLRDQLRWQPRVAQGGFWHKLIYPHQMWLDGAYMSAPFYAQYAAYFDEPAIFDDIALQLKLMADQTADAATGLLYHGWDASHQQAWAHPETGCSAHFWGRAIGWYLMALVDVLDHFPADHPDYHRLITLYTRTAAAIIHYQDQATGLWYQVVDQGSRAGNYLEASGAAMIVYALAKGLRKGYLPAVLRASAQKGYAGMLTHFLETDAQGMVNVTGICSVAGLGGNPYRSGTFDYYMSEPIVSNDYKGIGAFILASVENALVRE